MGLSQRRWAIIAAGLVAVAVGSWAAWQRSAKHRRYSGGELAVWSCGGAKEFVAPINEAFSKRHHCRIVYKAAPVQVLSNLIQCGLGSVETPDVYIPRSGALEKLLKAGTIRPGYKFIGLSTWVIAVPADNPAGIRGFDDLSREGVRVATCPGARRPNGKNIQRMLEEAGATETIGRNVVWQTDCPKEVLPKLAKGGIDACIMEGRLAVPFEKAGTVRTIEIEPKIAYAAWMTKRNSIWGECVLTNAPHPKLAQKYVEFLLSDEGQAMIADTGYVPATSRRINRYKPSLKPLTPKPDDLVRMYKPQKDLVPHWCPDSRHIAFISTRTGNRDIFVVDIVTRAVRNLTNAPSQEIIPKWELTKGDRMTFVSDRTGDRDVYVMNADGTGVINITHSPGMDIVPKWSFDGKRICFETNRDGNWELYATTPDGKGKAVNLTRNPANDLFPKQSHYGEHIAFLTNRDGNVEIYLMDPDGGNVRNLSRNPARDELPRWSHDDRHIVFVSNRSGNSDIWVMDADGSHQRNLTNHPARDFFPKWAMNNERIFFTSNRDGNQEIYVMDADGSNVRNLTNHPAQDYFGMPSWDGKLLAFASNRDGRCGIFVMNVDGTNVRRLTTEPKADLELGMSQEVRRYLASLPANTRKTGAAGVGKGKGRKEKGAKRPGGPNGSNKPSPWPAVTNDL